MIFSYSFLGKATNQNEYRLYEMQKKKKRNNIYLFSFVSFCLKGGKYMLALYVLESVQATSEEMSHPRAMQQNPLQLNYKYITIYYIFYSLIINSCMQFAAPNCCNFITSELLKFIYLRQSTVKDSVFIWL